MEKRFLTFYIANKPFRTTKISVSKTHKIGIFAKGIVHDLGQKVELFSCFVFIKIDREKAFPDVLDKKEAFKDYKNNCVRKTQNWNFFLGVSPSF